MFVSKCSSFRAGAHEPGFLAWAAQQPAELPCKMHLVQYYREIQSILVLLRSFKEPEARAGHASAVVTWSPPISQGSRQVGGCEQRVLGVFSGVPVYIVQGSSKEDGLGRGSGPRKVVT